MLQSDRHRIDEVSLRGTMRRNRSARMALTLFGHRLLEPDWILHNDGSSALSHSIQLDRLGGTGITWSIVVCSLLITQRSASGSSSICGRNLPGQQGSPLSRGIRISKRVMRIAVRIVGASGLD